MVRGKRAWASWYGNLGWGNDAGVNDVEDGPRRANGALEDTSPVHGRRSACPDGTPRAPADGTWSSESGDALTTD